jgi:hypothetical protein
MTEKQTSAISSTTKERPGAHKNLYKLAIYGVITIILACVPLLNLSSYILHVLILTFIYTVATVSLRFVVYSANIPWLTELLWRLAPTPRRLSLNWQAGRYG